MILDCSQSLCKFIINVFKHHNLHDENTIANCFFFKISISQICFSIKREKKKKKINPLRINFSQFSVNINRHLNLLISISSTVSNILDIYLSIIYIFEYSIKTHFQSRNCPICALQWPHLCTITPLYFVLAFKKQVLWQPSMC